MEEVRVLQHMPRNLWRTGGRMNFPLDGLVLYAPLGHPELSGSPIISKDLNALSCTIIGAVHQPPLGRAFDSTDDLLSVASSALVNNMSEFHFLCWAKHNGFVNFNSFIRKSLRTLAILSSSTLQGRIDYDTTNARSLATSIPTAGVFTFVEMTYSESGDRKVHIYYDLVEPSYSLQTASVGTILDESAFQLKLFGDSANGLNGLAGEAWIYSKVRALAERTHIRNTTKWRYA